MLLILILKEASPSLDPILSLSTEKPSAWVPSARAKQFQLQ